MTDWAPVITALIVGIPAILVGIGTLIKTTRTEKKADTIIEKAVEIHTLTNSSLSKVQAALETANERIIGLEKLVASITAQKQQGETPGATTTAK